MAASVHEQPATPHKPKTKSEEDVDIEAVVNENQRGFISNTMNANKFFKFHSKYGWLNVISKVIAAMLFSLLMLVFINSYYR